MFRFLFFCEGLFGFPWRAFCEEGAPCRLGCTSSLFISRFHSCFSVPPCWKRGGSRVASFLRVAFCLSSLFFFSVRAKLRLLFISALFILWLHLWISLPLSSSWAMSCSPVGLGFRLLLVCFPFIDVSRSLFELSLFVSSFLVLLTARMRQELASHFLAVVPCIAVVGYSRSFVLALHKKKHLALKCKFRDSRKGRKRCPTMIPKLQFLAGNA